MSRIGINRLRREIQDFENERLEAQARGPRSAEARNAPDRANSVAARRFPGLFGPRRPEAIAERNALRERSAQLAVARDAELARQLREEEEARRRGRRVASGKGLLDFNNLFEGGF